MIKGVIIFLFGAAAGGAAASFFTKKYVEKKFDRISGENKELKEYLQFLRDKDEAGNLAENLGYVEKEGEDLGEKESEASSKDVDKKVDYTRFYKTVKDATGIDLEDADNIAKEMHKQYEAAKEYDEKLKKEREEYNAKLEHPVDSDEDEDEEEEVKYDYETEQAIRMLNGDKKMEIIDAGQYDSYPYHDKITLYYYTDDKILATEDDEEIDDWGALIGNAIEETGFDQNQSQAIYVRNYSRGTDYEIGKVFGAFHE